MIQLDEQTRNQAQSEGLRSSVIQLDEQKAQLPLFDGPHRLTVTNPPVKRAAQDDAVAPERDADLERLHRHNEIASSGARGQRDA